MNGTLSGETFDSGYGRRCMRCFKKLANKHGVLPPSYTMHDIVTEGRYPRSGGSYAVRDPGHPFLADSYAYPVFQRFSGHL